MSAVTDGIVETGADDLLDVVEQVADLPWPADGEDWVEWELAGLDGHTSWLTHVLPLAATQDHGGVDALLTDFRRAADGRWGAPRRFDATRFTDDRSTDPRRYDRRSAPAALIRSIGAGAVSWWPLGGDAVVLADGVIPEDGLRRVLVLVLPSAWLLTGRGPEEEALEAAEESPLLADLLSGEARRITSAAWAVIRTRDAHLLTPVASALPLVRARTQDVELGGALLANRAHLDHALERLELLERGTCLCAAYPDHQLYDPETEAAAGHVRVEGAVPNDRQGRPDHFCACTACGRRFQVEQGEYHYPWWRWTALPGSPGDRAG